MMKSLERHKNTIRAVSDGPSKPAAVIDRSKMEELEALEAHQRVGEWLWDVPEDDAGELAGLVGGCW